MQYSLAVIPVWWLGAMAARVTPAWGIGPVEEFRRIQLLLMAVFGMAGIAVVLSRGMMPSRIVYLVSWLFGACFIPLVRVPVKKMLLLFGVWGCPTAVYGREHQVRAVIDDFIANPLLGYVPRFVFTNDLPAGAAVKGVPVQGTIDGSATASVAVVPVTLAENLSVSDQFDRVFSSYRKVVLIPDIKQDIFLWALPRTLGSLIGLEISSNLLNPAARLVKRAMDLLIVTCLAPLWIPLMAVLAVLIACVDRQNPFFAQHRVGRKKRLFRPLKFRTMVGNAEELLEQALLNDDALREEWAKSCKLKNDPRVTRTGKFLRRTSLDELPQLINVLLGQMSLVGPRPL
ncbi:MAG TPA: sugar transferase, partial [Tichowtungia sp.]|nr:sugar transferase [Tichowtungia sp.]